MRRLFLTLCVCCGCSFKVDTAAPTIALSGSAPIVTGPHLPLGNASAIILLQGADGNAWMERTGLDKTTLDCLTVAAPEETLAAAPFKITRGSIYLLITPTDPKMPFQLIIHRPGDTLADHQFLLPRSSKGQTITASADGELFVNWDNVSPTFHLQRRDESFAREIPIATMRPPGFAFDASGALIFHEEPCATGAIGSCVTVFAGSTSDDVDRSLGEVHGSYRISDEANALVVCGDPGLSVVPFDGSPSRILDPTPCESLLAPRTGTLTIVAGALFYEASPTGDLQLRSVPLDGSAAPTTIYHEQTGQRVLDFGPPGVLYSTQPILFENQTNEDGWLGDWQFMERGRSAGFNATFSRIHWLEHTAREYSVGDLLSAPITQGDSRPLALNVADFQELDDGRLLAADNQAFVGTQNRVVVIDEAAGVARWVADRATSFTGIPGTTDLAVQLIRDDGNFELVQVPLPATAE